MNFEFLMSVFFPRTCLACRKNLREGSLCDPCEGMIVMHRTLFCGACHTPLVRARSFCHPEFPFVLGAAASYENRVLRTLVHALKFSGVKEAARPLAAVLAQYASSLADSFHDFVVVPIPLSRERLRTRGFNQAEEIAQSLSERLGLRLETKALLRTRHAKPQSDIETPAERTLNIHGCFSVQDPEAMVRGKRVLLIDDVTTSGATFSEAARTLRTAGARAVVAMAALKA